MRRPDLLEKAELSKEDKKLIASKAVIRID
jgi:hypothetical protein